MCLMGRQDQQNSVTLHSVFTEGIYTISIYYELADGEEDMLSNIASVDCTLHVSLEPKIALEDRFNCDAGRLPHSMDSLMDSEGFLKYSDWIFADFSAKMQSTEFTIEKPSVFRVNSIEPSGIDVDLVLKDRKGIITQSNAVGGVEGLLAELKAGTFTLEISFVNSFVEDTRHKFCETVLIEIGLSPQEAVKAFSEELFLSECEDSTEELTNAFTGFKETLESKSVQIYPSSIYFTLPVSSLSEGEVEIFRGTFDIPKLVFSYFEIYSDFVTSDLSITLEKKSGKNSETIRGSSDALDLGEHGRRSFHSELQPGRYYFVIRTGPTAKMVSSSGQTTFYNADSDYKVLKRCVAFQLRIQFILTSEKSLKMWNCRGEDFRFLPKSFNTLDRLGTRKVSQVNLPTAVFYSSNIMAPYSHQNITDKVEIYLEEESVIRVLAESGGSPMILRVWKGPDIIMSEGSQSAKNPPIYSFSLTLPQHTSYTLEILHYQEKKECSMYLLLVEITPKTRISMPETCSESSPKDDFIVERLLEYAGLFELIDSEGVSTISQEPVFEFRQRTGTYQVTIPLEVTTESSMITGHILTSFAKSGLVLEILSEKEVIEWGRYKAPHRYELDPMALPSGTYELVIKEVSSAAVQTCVKYSGSILMEDVAFWDDISSMVKKTETCNYPDLPGSLNSVGLLKEGILSWHQKLMMDSIMGQTFIEFNLEEESLIAFYIVPQNNIEFSISIDLMVDFTTKLEGATSVTGVLDPGYYIIEVVYTSEFGLPNPRLCPGFEVDLNILPKSKYSDLASKFMCKSSQVIPGTLSETKQSNYLQYGKIDKNMEITIAEVEEIDIFASYPAILSGYIHLELYDAGNRLIKRSVGGNNWSSLNAPVPKGKYKLRIISDSAWEDTCWALGLSFTHRISEACVGGILPASLNDQESAPYGGPQDKFGAISFHGTFQADVENPKDILKIYAPVKAIVRIMTITSSFSRIESAVYREEIFGSPIAYSSNKSKFGSFIFELAEQTEPYFLVLSHILEDPEDCLLYDLKIVIEPQNTVSDILECKMNAHESLLPPTIIDFSEYNSIGSDEYAIFDDWMIGDKLPEGVTSKGKKNSKFVYQMELLIPKDGSISIESNYDFLTNDISIEILKEQEVVGSSGWRVISDEEIVDEENFSSVIEDLPLTRGKYKIVLKQGLASNHLVQRYSDISICFPFSFFIQFSSSGDSEYNKLSTVNPPDVSNLNVLQTLLLFLKFKHPVEDNEEVRSMFALKAGKTSIFPNEVVISESEPSRLKLKFEPNSFIPSTCYELDIISDELVGDSIKHQYCTSPCKCNPKANAECSEDKCVCPDPYTGTECFECIDGYEMEKKACIFVADESPKISAINFNIESPMRHSQQLRLYIDFTSAPYEKEGEKITRINAEAMKSAFLLASSSKSVKAFTVLPLVKSDTKWVLRYASEDLDYGESYELKIQPDFLFAANGKIFSFSHLPKLIMEVSIKDQDTTSCNGHGVEKGLVCTCDNGYKGSDCNICDDNFKKTESGDCEEVVEAPETDSSAALTSISLNGLVSVVQGDRLTIELEFSQRPYTEKGYVIDSLSNSKYMKNAFALQRIKADKYIFPISIRNSDKLGKIWMLDFQSSALDPDRIYKLVQVPYILYTAKGLSFSDPSVDLPKFKVFMTIDCGPGIQEQDKCICPSGYEGKKCDSCDSKFTRSLTGECILATPVYTQSSDSAEFSFTSALLYCLGYFLIVLLIIFAIRSVRKNQEFPREFELKESKQEYEGIDLYSS